MDWVRLSIRRPVGVAVGVLLVVMFGLIGLGAIPIQLTPTVDRPVVTVSTAWPGRSPQEVVDEITKEQEERLKNVANLKSMRSSSSEGSSTITLEFYVGSDLSRALQEVSDALRQVPDYPDDVDEPVIDTGESGPENAIAWMIIDLPVPPDAPPDLRERLAAFDITTLFDALDKEVKPYLERVDGVAQVNIYGGREREVRVLLDPVALAQRALNPLDVIAALRASNTNVSAGTIAEGKRDYRVRVVGQFTSTRDVLDTVVAWRDGRPVFVRDVGSAEIGHEKQRGFVRTMGRPCLAMNLIRQANANVVSVMEQARARLEEVRADILPQLGGEAGPYLRLEQVYDETVYIDSAIDLVLNNLWRGGLLAGVVLLVFLRSFIATGIIALAIPISVIGTFLVMLAFGRTLNVISLAGLAFATGMVVDNAVVVLENTYRRLQEGDAPFQAAYRGAQEVGGAILGSTLTTVAVFIPVLTIQEEAGQLFRDISLAVAVSVSLSLIVAVTVIPTSAARMLRHSAAERARTAKSALVRGFESLFGVAPLMARAVSALADAVHWLMSGWRAWSVRPLVIVALVAASLAGSRALMPPLDYLPTGNRNLVFGGLLIPPGYSIAHRESIAERIEARVGPYLHADLDDPASLAALPPIPRGVDFSTGQPRPPFDPVPIDRFFIGAFGGVVFCGATSQSEQVVIPVGQLLTNAMGTIPDAFGGARQASIFRGLGGGNSVNVEVSGPRLDRVTDAAGLMFGLAAGQWGYGNTSAGPANYNLTQPEMRLRLKPLGRELGLTVRDLGTAVRGLVDGAFVDDFRLGADTVDMVVLAPSDRLPFKERMATVPISTPAGPVVPLESVAEFEETTAPQEIQRIEELPAVSVNITPPVGTPVEQLMNDVRAKVIEPARRAGLIDQTMRVRLEGTAAKLDQVRSSLLGTGRAEPPTGWRRGLMLAGAGVAAAGLLALLWGVLRAGARRDAALAAGGLGGLLLALFIAALLAGIGWQPQLLTARFVWALAVTYLLMAALYESFLYPLVIMFSVPLALVGGFASLRIVHDLSLRNPTMAPQNLDVLTMLGFIILVGTVVNNAILLVEQALMFMRPSRFGDEPSLPQNRAIAESVRTRVRPIFMTTTTTLGGLLPLVVAPGAGSEMYRGLGAVVLGGLLVSTVFTLVLVPLALSLTMDLATGFRALVFGARAPASMPAAEALAQATPNGEPAVLRGTPDPSPSVPAARGS